MTNQIIIIALILALIYLYYQNRKLKGLPTSGNSETIFELDEDLVADKDEAIRKKNEVEAENLSLNNRLKNKQQEVLRKEQEIERLKSEKSQVEISLNEKIKELKTKYSKQGQLLDQEQLENNKLVEQIEKLTEEIKKLKGNLPGSFPEEDN